MTFKVCVKSLFTPLEEGSIEGYASVFGGVDSYGDTIEKTAFDNVIKSGQKPLMFYQHNRWSLPIGVWESLSVDEKGHIIVYATDSDNKSYRQEFEPSSYQIVIEKEDDAKMFYKKHM